MTSFTDLTLHSVLFKFSILLSALILSSPTIVRAQGPSFDLNPITDFCSRWWSQSVVKNNVLYIDSGLQKWNGSATGFGAYGINNHLITIPLSTTFNWKTDIIINSEPKNETNPMTGTTPPSLMRGHLFHGPANVSEIYLYGGTTYMGNRSFPTWSVPESSQYPLWTFDYNTTSYPWNQYDISTAWKPNHGAAAEAIDQGLGFYLNGQIDEGTSSSTLDKVEPEVDFMPLDGMVVINFYDHSSRNVSTSSIRGNAPRVGGTMEYLSPVGERGVLVALGGQINRERPVANMSEGELLDFSVVDVFDISSYYEAPSNNGSWYQQNTTGDIPPARVNFCTVAVSAPDNSSHHIYMYGGNDPTKKGVAFDDIYVLTLPSFTWTSVFADGESPRWGHNCHRVSERQLVTVGGNLTNIDKCDWERKGIAFFDMTSITWGSVFLTNSTNYLIPEKLLGATGGVPQGNATIKEPPQGWTENGLAEVFGIQNKKPNVGAIAGGVVGGVAVIAIIAAALFFLKRRRDRARGPHELHSRDLQNTKTELGNNEKIKHELQGINENNPAELPGPPAVELNAPREFVEADHTTATKAAELSATSTVAGGLHGVPMIRTPGDDLPTPPDYSPGVSPQSINTTAWGSDDPTLSPSRGDISPDDNIPSEAMRVDSKGDYFAQGKKEPPKPDNE